MAKHNKRKKLKRKTPTKPGIIKPNIPDPVRPNLPLSSPDSVLPQAMKDPFNIFDNDEPSEDTSSSEQSSRPPPREMMISSSCALREQTNSSFLNRFFPEDDDSSGNGAALAEINQLLRDGPEGPSREPTPKEARRAERVQKIFFQTYGNDFKVEAHGDRLLAQNQRVVRLFERGRILGLGVKMNIPMGYCAVTNCFHPPGCVCVMDMAGYGPSDIRAQIVNISSGPLELPPNMLQIHIHMLPMLLPEPWQTINLMAPHQGDTYFDLRLRRPLSLRPRASKNLKFEAGHLCEEDASSCLIIPCRHLAAKRVLLDPTVWRPNSLAVLRVMNASDEHVDLEAGMAMAKIIFTTPGITPFKPSLTSVMMSFDVPRSDLKLVKGGRRDYYRAEERMRSGRDSSNEG
ncbi:M72 protein [Murid betaherpesvirus 1]|nr:M72 protein [Murid betaherpesvirus 1]